MMSYGQTAGIQVPNQKVSWLLYAWSHYRFPRFRSRVFFKVGGWKKKKKQGATWSIEPRCQLPTWHLLYYFWNGIYFSSLFLTCHPSHEWISQSVSQSVSGRGKIKNKNKKVPIRNLNEQNSENSLEIRTTIPITHWHTSNFILAWNSLRKSIKKWI